MTSNPHQSGAVRHAGAALERATLAVVLLHGRGGSPEDILGLESAWDLPDVAYLAPQASGSTWYPLSFMAPRAANEPYLSSALAKIDSVVRSIEQAGIDRNRIVIAGFSQGACLASEFVASHPGRYGGLVAFTGGLIGPPGSIAEPSTFSGKELGGMPVFMGSGDPDPHVPWARVEESAAVFKAMGAMVRAQRYPGRPHTITAGELAEARGLLLQASS